MLPPPPPSTLFPYTTLFRSRPVDLDHRATDLSVPAVGYRKHQARLADRGPESALRTRARRDRKSTRLNSSHVEISYAVFCLKKKIINTGFMDIKSYNRIFRS